MPSAAPTRRSSCGRPAEWRSCSERAGSPPTATSTSPSTCSCAGCGRSRAQAGSPASLRPPRSRHPEPLPAAPERCAVVLGTRFASIEPLVEFNRAALTDGPGLVNPSSFPNVVVNAHAGYLGILFGLAGPNVTLCGEAAGLDALAQALDLLELGRADAVLAGGVEAYGETLFEGLRRAGADEPEEAAAFLLLARDGAGPRLERSDLAAGGAAPRPVR